MCTYFVSLMTSTSSSKPLNFKNFILNIRNSMVHISKQSIATNFARQEQKYDYLNTSDWTKLVHMKLKLYGHIFFLTPFED